MDELEALVLFYKFSLGDAKSMSLRERANWINRSLERQARRAASNG
jgi:hypothetical protein